MATDQEEQPDLPATELLYDEVLSQAEEFEEREPAPQKETAPEERQGRQAIRSETFGKRAFTNGLAVGVGIGCIAIFSITWFSLFFIPAMPETITYETLLSVFIYPLVYWLAFGLITLTAGTVREYYSPKQYEP